MLCAGVVLPHPPLLVPEVASGAAAELDVLRAACTAALTDGLAERPDRVVLVGTGDPGPGRTSLLIPEPTLAPYGLAGPPGQPAEGLPLALTIGWWVLDLVGWTGARGLRTVSPDMPPHACATLGSGLAAARGRTMLVVLGDGSARRSQAAPGHLDSRAEGFDALVAAALATGDAAGLLGLDGTLAEELLAIGRAPWQVLAGAARATAMSGRLYYAEAPYGVGYFVSCWRPASREGAPGAG